MHFHWKGCIPSWPHLLKLSAVICFAFSCKLRLSGTEIGQNQTMKCNVCKYYLPPGLTGRWLVFSGGKPQVQTHQQTLLLQTELFNVYISHSPISLFLLWLLWFPLCSSQCLGTLRTLTVTSSPLCGFEASVWHARFHLRVVTPDLGPNSASGVPQETTTAVSSVFK